MDGVQFVSHRHRGRGNSDTIHKQQVILGKLQRLCQTGCMNLKVFGLGLLFVMAKAVDGCHGTIGAHHLVANAKVFNSDAALAFDGDRVSF